MKNRDRYGNVACVGMDVHYQFSNVTMRNAAGEVLRRERLDHRDRAVLRRRLAEWPSGLEVVMEASFGWNWLADEMTAAGMKVSLSNCYKLEQMRKARGGAKTNRKDADLVSLLPMELSDWGNPGTPYEWHCRADGHVVGAVTSRAVSFAIRGEGRA